MSIIRADLITKAKIHTQDPSGNPLLQGDATDYGEAIDVALSIFDRDRPNLRTVHHTVTSSAYRYILAGAGAIAGMAGIDAWVRGQAQVSAIFHPYSTISRDNYPLDETEYRIVEEPSGIVALELLNITPASGVLRIEYVRPHVVDVASASNTSLLASDVAPMAVLVASVAMQIAANRKAQNVGTSTIPNDIVDRRSETNEYASRSRDLRKLYQSMIGSSAENGIRSAGKVAQMNVEPVTAYGYLWKRPRLV